MLYPIFSNRLFEQAMERVWGGANPFELTNRRQDKCQEPVWKQSLYFAVLVQCLSMALQKNVTHCNIQLDPKHTYYMTFQKLFITNKPWAAKISPESQTLLLWPHKAPDRSVIKTSGWNPQPFQVTALIFTAEPVPNLCHTTRCQPPTTHQSWIEVSHTHVPQWHLNPEQHRNTSLEL